MSRCDSCPFSRYSGRGGRAQIENPRVLSNRMSAVTMPVSRAPGRALIIGSAAARAQPLSVLQRLGYTCAEIDDPYAAALELARRPLVYRAVVLSLTSLHREELPIVATIKQRFPHLEIWLAHIEGRA